MGNGSSELVTDPVKKNYDRFASLPNTSRYPAAQRAIYGRRFGTVRAPYIVGYDRMHAAASLPVAVEHRPPNYQTQLNAASASALAPEHGRRVRLKSAQQTFSDNILANVKNKDQSAPPKGAFLPELQKILGLLGGFTFVKLANNEAIDAQDALGSLGQGLLIAFALRNGNLSLALLFVLAVDVTGFFVYGLK